MYDLAVRCWQISADAATISGMKRAATQRNTPSIDAISYAGYRFPHVIIYAVWLNYRFPLSLRMVEELLLRVAYNSRMRPCGAGR